jgi:hypothetical protein
MDQSSGLISHHVGFIAAMLTTAVLVGVMIGWLFSPGMSAHVGETQSTMAATATAQLHSVIVRSPTAQPSTAVVQATALPLSVPSAEPTPAVVAPSATITPPIAVTSSATSTPPAIALLQQIAAAEAVLRMGELDAALDYGQGTQAVAHVRFDLGTDQRPPRLDFRTTYQGTSNPHTIETIAIGERSWEQQGTSGWKTVAMRKGLWDQIQFFLPHAQLGTQPNIDMQNGQPLLRWYDPAHDADVTLRIDPARTVPRELQRQMRRTGLRLTVTYVGWDAPIEIQPPAGF